MLKIMFGHAEAGSPVPVMEAPKTPGSYPTGSQVTAKVTWPHDGVTTMPSPPAGQGDPSPKLQTVLNADASAPLLRFVSVTLAGSPV